MIVVDAMVLVYLRIPVSTRHEEARSVYRSDPSWWAPPLWISEVRSAFWQHIRSEDPDLHVPKKVAMSHLAQLESLMEERTQAVSSEQTVELALQSGCSPYDCEYVALAEDLDELLVTEDPGLLDAYPDQAISMSAFIGSV